eukprot:TRINITY_DN262_c0_g1_i1.p1 TRINITY_DN262_c0_g1~~TRINITY_DN262_c0_g1_i1.p1  ORF type:complete len:204 (+),score=46.75 TRINITY_DN262_c0_g1_i1:18-629(+)
MSGRLFQYKLLLLGESTVGKSSIVLRFVHDRFVDKLESTVGAAFTTKSVPLDDGVTVKYEIWDTAGQERYNSLAPLYYRGAQAAIIVYDITSQSSFERAKAWVRELMKHKQTEESLVMALVGNKLDLEDDREIQANVADEYRKECNVDIFLETSAKQGTNVYEVFLEIARKLPKETRATNNDSATITVRNPEDMKKSRCCGYY